MSVLSYLQALSSKLVLSTDESISIAVSLGFLKTNLGRWSHSDEIKTQEAFGSYKRETILPRKYDEGSDVDYMIVFKNVNNYDPETYRTWLQKFAESYYSRSEIYKDFPTVVLELGHIKFELVPAIQSLWGTYQIPDNTTYFNKWQSTDPFSLKNKITEANKLNSNIRPLIRVLKYWNARNGKPFASFQLEEKIASYAYWGYSLNLEDCFHGVVDTLYADYNMSEAKKRAINNLKAKSQQARDYKRLGYNSWEEDSIRSLFEWCK